MLHYRTKGIKRGCCSAAVKRPARNANQPTLLWNKSSPFDGGWLGSSVYLYTLAIAGPYLWLLSPAQGTNHRLFIEDRRWFPVWEVNPRRCEWYTCNHEFWEFLRTPGFKKLPLTNQWVTSRRVATWNDYFINTYRTSTHTTATDKTNISITMVQDEFVEPILAQTRHSVASAAALFEKKLHLHCIVTAQPTEGVLKQRDDQELLSRGKGRPGDVTLGLNPVAMPQRRKLWPIKQKFSG